MLSLFQRKRPSIAAAPSPAPATDLPKGLMRSEPSSATPQCWHLNSGTACASNARCRGPTAWMRAQRLKVPEGSAIARALDYNLKRRVVLNRYLDDGDVSIDINWVENQIRPWRSGGRIGYSRVLYAPASVRPR